jgi:hypothetical protein
VGLAEKKLTISGNRKREWVEPGHPPISLRRQCVWWGLARGHRYDQPVSEGLEHLDLLRWLDEPYPATPLDRMRWRTAWLRSRGSAVHPQRGRRVLRRMGLEAGVRLPELAQKVVFLYENQEMQEKRRLLDFVCSDSTWKDGKLILQYRKHFYLRAVTNQSYKQTQATSLRGSGLCPMWLPFVDSFRTLCLAPTLDMKAIFYGVQRLALSG